MIALMVLTGPDEVLEAYEWRLLDVIELSDAERELRREVRMLEKEREWKRVVRMLTDAVGRWKLKVRVDERSMIERSG